MSMNVFDSNISLSSLEELVRFYIDAGYTDDEIKAALFGKKNSPTDKQDIRSNASEADPPADTQRSEAAFDKALRGSKEFLREHQRSGAAANPDKHSQRCKVVAREATRLDMILTEHFSSPEKAADFLANLGYCPYREDMYDECKYGWHTPEETCPECVLAWLSESASPLER